MVADKRQVGIVDAVLLHKRLVVVAFKLGISHEQIHKREICPCFSRGRSGLLKVENHFLVAPLVFECIFSGEPVALKLHKAEALAERGVFNLARYAAHRVEDEKHMQVIVAVEVVVYVVNNSHSALFDFCKYVAEFCIVHHHTVVEVERNLLIGNVVQAFVIFAALGEFFLQ